MAPDLQTRRLSGAPRSPVRCAGQATPAPETGAGSAKSAPLVPSAATTSAHSGTIMHQRHQSGHNYENFFFFLPQTPQTVRPMLHNEISMLNRRQWTFGAHLAPSRRPPGAHLSEGAPRAPSAPPAAPTGNLSPRLGRQRRKRLSSRKKIFYEKYFNLL